MIGQHSRGKRHINWIRLYSDFASFENYVLSKCWFECHSENAYFTVLRFPLCRVMCALRRCKDCINVAMPSLTANSIATFMKVSVFDVSDIIDMWWFSFEITVSWVLRNKKQALLFISNNNHRVTGISKLESAIIRNTSEFHLPSAKPCSWTF